MKRDISKIPQAIRRRTYASSPETDGAYTEDQVEFLKAIQRYKQEKRRPFPTWTEVLEIAIALGYRKVAEPMPLPPATPKPKVRRDGRPRKN